MPKLRTDISKLFFWKWLYTCDVRAIISKKVGDVNSETMKTGEISVSHLLYLFGYEGSLENTRGHGRKI